MSDRKGFTYLEVVLSAVIVSLIIFSFVLYIEPNRIADGRNAVRRLNVNILAEAIYLYYLDNDSWPKNIKEEPLEICRTNAKSCSGMIDLSELTVKYLEGIPADPLVRDGNGTGYTIMIKKDQLKISSIYAESDVTIEVSR